MARKPSRFWHPARRLFSDAQEAARVALATRTQPASLDEVRPRLQHYLRAIYGDAFSIESIAPGRQHIALKLLRNAARTVSGSDSKSNSESDERCVRLPATLPPCAGNASALERYRVLAVQHVERVRRQTSAFARRSSHGLERDLFLLAESVAIDAQIAATQPGLEHVLHTARQEALLRRQRARVRSPLLAHFERLVQSSWNAASSVNSSAAPDERAVNSPEENLAWARTHARELLARYGSTAARQYTSARALTLWSTAVNSAVRDDSPQPTVLDYQGHDHEVPNPMKASESTILPPNTSARSNKGSTPDNSEANQSEIDATARKSESQQNGAESQDASHEADEQSQVSNTNPDASNRSSKQSESQNDSANESPSDARESDGDQSSGTPGAGTTHSVNADVAGDANATPDANAIRYPEWDFSKQGFTENGSLVHVSDAVVGEASWALSVLQQHAREVQRAQRQFERLRSARQRLRRQTQGEELDLDACVEAMVDRRMRVAPSDRLYAHVRPGRRELAISLLLDLSGSTADVVIGDQRVIDIERIAALIAMQAFDALGDDYNVLAFSSSGSQNVQVRNVRAFGERGKLDAQGRVSALEPHGTTRLGAAVRHAAATLTRHHAPHKLLLILTDGKPHDYDWYFTDYAVQDTRQAILHARTEGIHPFCITVDAAEGETYLPDIFGSAGYRVVSSPAQLPNALLLAVQRMIGNG
ncbi:MAG: VWA domain-containing protein [Gemmatimonas sp.]